MRTCVGTSVQATKFPKVPLLALTATATTKVLQDVKSILHIPNCPVFTVRPSAHLIAHYTLLPHQVPACNAFALDPVMVGAAERSS